jgi:hypothetical protein
VIVERTPQAHQQSMNKIKNAQYCTLEEYLEDQIEIQIQRLYELTVTLASGGGDRCAIRLSATLRSALPRVRSILGMSLPATRPRLSLAPKPLTLPTDVGSTTSCDLAFMFVVQWTGLRGAAQCTVLLLHAGTLSKIQHRSLP